MYLNAPPPQRQPHQHNKKAHQHPHRQPHIVHDQRRRHAPQHAQDVEAAEHGVPWVQMGVYAGGEACQTGEEDQVGKRDVHKIRHPRTRQAVKTVGVIQAVPRVVWVSFAVLRWCGVGEAGSFGHVCGLGEWGLSILFIFSMHSVRWMCI